jgi:hypothetical protein
MTKPLPLEDCLLAKHATQALATSAAVTVHTAFGSFLIIDIVSLPDGTIQMKEATGSKVVTTPGRIAGVTVHPFPV